MRRILLAVFLIVACTTVAEADPSEDAELAYMRGDYTQAVLLLRSLAEQGDEKAQFHLGLLYTNRQGIPYDFKEAQKWYSKAAEHGNVWAQFFADRRRPGDPPDYPTALKWYRRVAEQGDVFAQFHLGLMYTLGDGVAPDDQAALKWFLRAAAQGDASAQNNLGLMYKKGRGVPQDFIRAHMWYNLAAARLRLDGEDAMKARDQVATQMTTAQIGKAQEMALRCQQSKFKECD